MKNLTFILLLVAVFCIFTSCEKSDAFVNANENASTQIDGLIQSADDFSRIVTTKETALNKLSPKTLQIFKESLRFNVKGELATARVMEVKEELSPEDFVNIWTLFNVDQYEIKAVINDLNHKKDYAGHKCVGPNNCKKARRYICLAGCSESLE